jgi:hypothetical protein
VVGICRDQNGDKLAEFAGQITVMPGATDDRDVLQKAVAGCDGVLVVLVPRASTITRRERRRRCSTTLSQGHGWCSRAGGTSPSIAGTSIHGGSERSSTSAVVSPPPARLRHRRPGRGPAGEYSPATRAGPSCVAATSSKARAKACPCEAHARLLGGCSSPGRSRQRSRRSSGPVVHAAVTWALALVLDARSAALLHRGARRECSLMGTPTLSPAGGCAAGAPSSGRPSAVRRCGMLGGRALGCGRVCWGGRPGGAPGGAGGAGARAR